MIYTDENILKARKEAEKKAIEAAPMMLGAMLRGGCAVTYVDSAPAVLKAMLDILGDGESEKKAEKLKHEEKSKAVYFFMTPMGISAVVGSYTGKKAMGEMFGTAVSAVNEADAVIGDRMPATISAAEAKMIMPLVADGTVVLCSESDDLLEGILKESGNEYDLPKEKGEYTAIRYSEGMIRGRKVSRQTLMDMGWMNIFMLEKGKGKK